ncbi:hypothetical protein L1887_57927 [Cichorium endivia]|nr:hypothetical protein L1887_57927 [Cichorium endivia]
MDANSDADEVAFEVVRRRRRPTRPARSKPSQASQASQAEASSSSKPSSGFTYASKPRPSPGGGDERAVERARAVVDCKYPRKIVCLGLGSPTSSRSAQIQLALLVVLRTFFTHQRDAADTKDATTSPSAESAARRVAQQATAALECLAYDPVFSSFDTALLAHYNVRTLSSHVSQWYAHPQSLLYMPHCDRDLYESVLSTWTPPYPVLLSNTLSLYTITPNLADTAPNLHRLCTTLTATALPNWNAKRRAHLTVAAPQDAVDVVGDVVRWWDKHALHDLSFHYSERLSH